ncbi:MAG TPA: DNA polymerase Y family protein [Pirellulaceae bacterium]|nr:DNA polymerase Y family protein [Pirellulaceae bacterium]
MKRILCLWLPDWPTQRVRRCPDALPLALHARDTRRGEVIATCNHAAHQVGIVPGVPLTEAQSLLRHSGRKFMLAAYDAPRDREELERLAEHCERYSPSVGLGEAYPSPAGVALPAFDSLLLDITSIGPLFQGEPRLAEALHADLQTRGYRGQLAIADNVATAWGIAHFAKQATTIVETGWPALQPLPIAALRLDPAVVRVLHELGIETVEHLAALPHAALATRFGVELTHQLERALGTYPELITPLRAAPEFHAEWLLEYPTTDRGALAKILEQLTSRLADALRQRGQGALQLVCRLDIAEHPPSLARIGLYRPSAEASHFLELLRLQGEALRLRGAVGRVGLAAVTTSRLEQRQRELFAGAHDRLIEESAALINRLSNRLGRERVTRVRLTREVLPERACELLPLSQHDDASPPAYSKRLTQRRDSEKTRSPIIIQPQANSRPLLLLPEPVRLAAIFVTSEGLPQRFIYQRQPHVIARSWGPERIETAWWRGPQVRRDYHRVEVADGRRFWLFHELRSGQWFLHGHFD